MKKLVALALVVGLVGLAGCNSILGIKDLGGGDDDDDGGGGGPMVRFLLVTPDVYDLDPTMPVVALHLPGGAKLVDATYGELTAFLELDLVQGEMLELRLEGGSSVSVAITFDRPPVAGERATVVVVGNLLQTDVSAADAPRMIGFNEAEYPDDPDPHVRLVHAVVDQPLSVSFAIAEETTLGEPTEVGALGAVSSRVAAFADGGRLRVGRNVTSTPGTEELSFSLPVFSGGDRVLLVVAGRQNPEPNAGGPAIALYVLPIGGGDSVVQPDPTFFIVNHLSDYAGDSMWIAGSNDGVPLSRSVSSASDPMVVFLSEGVAIDVIAQGLSSQISFTLPAGTLGSRSYIALAGLTASASAHQVSTGLLPLEQDGLRHWLFSHASPDAGALDVEVSVLGLFDLRATGIDYGGEVNGDTDSLDGWRVSPAGGGSPLATFDAVVSASRSVTVLSGTQGSGLIVTTTDLDTWPWLVGGAVPGQ